MSQSDFAMACGKALDASAPPNGTPALQEEYEDACPTDPSLQNSSQMEPIARDQSQQRTHRQAGTQAGRQADRLDLDQSLDGWLFAIVALNIIGSIRGFFEMFSSFNALHGIALYAQEGGLAAAPGLTAISGLLAFATWISGVFFIILLLKKNKRFFLAFLISGVLYIANVAVLLLIERYIFRDSGFRGSSIFVAIVLISVFGLVAQSLYFVCSKRVRKYMGSEEYLRRPTAAEVRSQNSEFRIGTGAT